MSDQYVADRIALLDVMATYAMGVDERDFDAYGSCFADDVVVTGFGKDEFHGREAWVAYVIQALEQRPQALIGTRTPLQFTPQAGDCRAHLRASRREAIQDGQERTRSVVRR